jgi:hypothetical protein
MSRLQRLLLALAVAIPVGLLGAQAFNPDSGFLLHSMVLWRIFGLIFELGLPLLLILTVLSSIISVISRRSRSI